MVFHFILFTKGHIIYIGQTNWFYIYRVEAYVASRTQSWILQYHILRDSGICGTDFDSVLDGLHEIIPSFDLSSFTRKDIVPLKA
jgi:hypothetical protein